jgi:hypothetical protein
MELADQLKQDGEAKGLCRLWRGKLRSGMSIEGMVRLFIKGIDFCISENYPTIEFMRANFKGKCEQYGAFVDDEIESRKNAPDTVLNGDCKAMLEYDGFTVSRIFIRHNSQAAVIASDNAMVTIDAFDSANLVVATAGNNAQIYVNLYSNAQVECIGFGIHVKKMNKETY